MAADSPVAVTAGATAVEGVAAERAAALAALAAVRAAAAGSAGIAVDEALCDTQSCG